MMMVPGGSAVRKNTSCRWYAAGSRSSSGSGTTPGCSGSGNSSASRPMGRCGCACAPGIPVASSPQAQSHTVSLRGTRVIPSPFGRLYTGQFTRRLSAQREKLAHVRTKLNREPWKEPLASSCALRLEPEIAQDSLAGAPQRGFFLFDVGIQQLSRPLHDTAGNQDSVDIGHAALHHRGSNGVVDRKQVEISGFFFQAEDGIRDLYVTGVQTCALPI